jgi:hypothetical protein
MSYHSAQLSPRDRIELSTRNDSMPPRAISIQWFGSWATGIVSWISDRAASPDIVKGAVHGAKGQDVVVDGVRKKERGRKG